MRPGVLEPLDPDEITHRLRGLVEAGVISRWSSSEGPFGPRYVVTTHTGDDFVSYGDMPAYLRGIEVGRAHPA